MARTTRKQEFLLTPQTMQIISADEKRMQSTAALQLDATVIVTTSAVPSHPSTALLDATLASLSLCTAFSVGKLRPASTNEEAHATRGRQQRPKAVRGNIRRDTGAWCLRDRAVRGEMLLRDKQHVP